MGKSCLAKGVKVAWLFQDAKITGSGSYDVQKYPISQVADGKVETSWVTQEDGEKWLQFEFPEVRTVGCIQFVNGWQQGDAWNGMIGDYRIEYEKDGTWVEMIDKDVTEDMNFANDFHTYGLEWNEKELIFYFDRKEIRRVKNDFCYSAAPVWLSLAIIPWAGPVSDAIDGTCMEVDYVRIYNRK